MRTFIASIFVLALAVPALAQPQAKPAAAPAKQNDAQKPVTEAARVLTQWQQKMKLLRHVQAQQGKLPRTPDEELRMRGLLLRRMNPIGE